MADEYSFEKVVRVVKEIAERRLYFPIIEKREEMASLTQFLSLTIPNLRFHLISDASVASEIWNEVRGNQRVCDFVCSGTNEMVARLAHDKSHIPFIHDIAAGLSALSVGESDTYACIDTTLSGAIVHKQMAMDMLSQNPWLIFLYALSCTGAGPLVEAIRFDLETHPSGKDKEGGNE